MFPLFLACVLFYSSASEAATRGRRWAFLSSLPRSASLSAQQTTSSQLPAPGAGGEGAAGSRRLNSCPGRANSRPNWAHIGGRCLQPCLDPLVMPLRPAASGPKHGGRWVFCLPICPVPLPLPLPRHLPTLPPWTIAIHAHMHHPSLSFWPRQQCNGGSIHRDPARALPSKLSFSSI